MRNLYGKEIENYLFQVDIEAQKLRHYQRRMENPDRFTNGQWDEMVQKETSLILWFADTLIKGKKLFGMYLRLGDR